jgi:membrane protein YdbS with pleckstrin-like domain
MSYTERLMSSGERIVIVDRQHWFVVLANGRYGVAAILGALLLVIVQAVAKPDPGVSNVLGAVAAILFIVGLAVLAWEVLRYQNQQYVITNRRVLQVSGVINKHSGDSSLEKINDADLTQSVLGRMFNFGDLDVLTASDAGIDRMRMIHDPVGFKRAMLDAKHDYEVDMSRGPAPVSPPLRAASPVRPPDPAPAIDPDPTSSQPVPVAAPLQPSEPSSAPAPTPRMSADEVTRTLASLADLRDRGAISPEEYDAKKADLLGRL